MMAKEAARRQRRQHSGKIGSVEAEEGKRGTTKVIEAARRKSKCNSHRSTVKNRYRKVEIGAERQKQQRQRQRLSDRGREPLQNFGNHTLQPALYI